MNKPIAALPLQLIYSHRVFKSFESIMICCHHVWNYLLVFSSLIRLLSERITKNLCMLLANNPSISVRTKYII